MNEEKLKQILNKIGQTDVPPDIARIAGQNSQAFTAALNVLQSPPHTGFFTGLRLIAAAAIVIFAFAIGRFSRPLPITSTSPAATLYASAIFVSGTTNKNADSFWQQKAMAAMQSRPYVQSTTATNRFNAYKQYLKEKYNE